MTALGKRAGAALLAALFCLPGVAPLSSWAAGHPAMGTAEAAPMGQPSVLIASALFAEVAEKALEQELSSNGEKRRHELKAVRLPQDMLCPAGSLDVEAKLTASVRYDKTVPVTVLIYVDGELYRRATCYYAVHVYDTVAVASHSLPLNKELTAADMRLEEREIPSRDEVYIKDRREAVGRVPTRVIREGTLLTQRLLQNPIVIEAGSPVRILASHNGVRAESEGIALQRGRVGKKIRVRNAKSAKILQGRVIDANTVEIGS